MAKYDYDLFVIGAGSGGVRGARMAAATGARVGIAEEYRYGGTCVIRGCIPKKLLVYASHFHEDFEDAAGFGWEVPEAGFDWARLIASKDREIARLEGVYRRLLDNAGVEMHDGRAVMVDPHTVEVGGRRMTAGIILIATGGHPFIPDHPGIEHAITSNEAFHLSELPRRVMVAGGGYIAVEFAGIFNGLGAEVTQVYRGPRVLRGFDEDIRARVDAEMAKKGVAFKYNTVIDHVARRADGVLEVALTDGATLEVDCLMLAIGRRPNTAGLGLEEAGVALGEKGAVAVDAYSRTSRENIYAVGDVTDRINLTPVALAEAMAFVDTVFKGVPRAMNHETVASAVFSQPPVATVGLTEDEARARLDRIEIYRSSFRPLKHTLSGRDEKAMMKLVVDARTRRILGAHMVGPDAAEIIQGVAIAVKMGATKEDFDATVGIHPTAAEEFVTMREPVPEPEKQAAE
ncbi:MAG: glutathione-disulfide reductase [Kiloniellales bacterium]|nr:glutathione-disulfide reductase [Kiloniellales bacterium]